MTFRIDFIIGGAQRSGTTALFYLLKNHPQIFLYEKKEAHFFTNDKLFTYNFINYDYYHALFVNHKQGQITGEATPSYLFHPEAAKRIHKYNPQIKLIFLLRNPSDRAYSQFIQKRGDGGERRSFEQAILDELKGKKPDFGYLSQGLYVKQLQRYIDSFSQEQLFIRTHDSFKNENLNFLYAVFNFLNVKKVICQNNPFERFIDSTYEPMSQTTRDILIDFFQPEIEKLEQLLNWDLSNWKHQT